MASVLIYRRNPRYRCYRKYFIYDISFGYSIVCKTFIHFILPKGYGVNLNPRGEPSQQESLRFCDLNFSYAHGRMYFVC